MVHEFVPPSNSHEFSMGVLSKTNDFHGELVKLGLIHCTKLTFCNLEPALLKIETIFFCDSENTFRRLTL